MATRQRWATHTLAYRFRALSEALGWTYKRLAQVSGIPYSVIKSCLAAGGRYFSGTRRSKKKQPMLQIETLKKLLAIEAAYEDILKKYRKKPVMLDRTPKANRYASVKLRPIEVRRPTDLREVGVLGGDSKAKAEDEQARAARQRKQFRHAHAISRGWAKKIADGWVAPKSNKAAQPGRSNDAPQGAGSMAQGTGTPEPPKRRNFLRARKCTDGKAKKAGSRSGGTGHNGRS